MAGSYNRISIIGNLGRDPETRMLPSGDNVATFSVATTERNKNGDVTTWFRVSAFGKLADTCQQYLHKMLLANPHYGFRARQTACDHACHRPVRRAPLRFASSILHKGSYVYIEGGLSQNEYTNREGQVRQSLEVRAREMRMLDKADDRGAESDGGDTAPAYNRQSTPASAVANDMGSMDDIPF